MDSWEAAMKRANEDAQRLHPTSHQRDVDMAILLAKNMAWAYAGRQIGTAIAGWREQRRAKRAAKYEAIGFQQEVRRQRWVPTQGRYGVYMKPPTVTARVKLWDDPATLPGHHWKQVQGQHGVYFRP